MVKAFNEILRDFATDGVPSSGPHQPIKADFREALTAVEAFSNASGSALVYQDRATLFADLAHAANTMAWVVNDATTAYNGIYEKSGASGAGSWTRVADLPYSFIVATNSGAGTANAIQATTAIPVTSSALVLLPIVATASSSPITVSFNGDTALTIKTVSGNVASALTTGMWILGTTTGSDFRMLNDQDVAALVAQAETARDEAVAAAASINQRIYTSVADATADTIGASVKRIKTQFYSPSYADVSTLVGGANYIRISFASLTGYPSTAYFRSVDRYMPDGTTDATNGGYWVIDEKSLSPFMFGARIDVSTYDSGQAIQDSIDTGNLLKLKVVLPIGTLYTAQTLHVYAQSVLTGHGKSQSFIKAKDGSGVASDGKGVLETYNFLTLTDTATKFVTDAGMTWGFVLKGFTVDGNRQVNYGGVSGTRYGGVGTGIWDGFGIRLYGRRYIVEDIGIQYCAGIGFYSELGNPSAPSPSDWYYNALNNQQGHIKDMCVSQCSYDGFVFFGPGDISIDDVTTELNHYPDATLFGTERASLLFPTELISGMVFADKTVTGGSAVGGCEIGFVHSHTNKNGWGIRFQGDVFLRIRTNNLTSEGNLGQIKGRGYLFGQWDKVNVRNDNADTNVGDGTLPDIDIESAQPLSINSMEIRSSTGNLGSIRLRIGSDNLQFGMVAIRGGTAGHGVVIESNVDHVIIDHLVVTDFRGTAIDGNPSRGLWTKSGVTNVYIGEALIKNNDIGWRNDSSGEIVIARGRIDADAVTYPGIVSLDLSVSPSGFALRQCGFTTFDGTTTKANTFSGNSSVDPTLTTEQTLTWTHGMWRTPSINEMAWGYITNGTNRPTLQYAELIAPTSTQLSMRVKFSVAGNGTSGGSAFTAKI